VATVVGEAAKSRAQLQCSGGDVELSRAATRNPRATSMEKPP